MQIRKSTEKRKEEAIKAALKIIYEKGFSKLTVRGIAEELGISEAALYRHFAGKKDIIDQLTDLVFDQECVLEINDDADGLKILSDIIIEQAKKFEKNPFLSIISFQDEMFREYPAIKEKFNEHQKEREQEIIYVIKKGIKEGKIRKDINPKAFASIFMGSIRVTVLKWKNNNFSYSLKKELKKIKKELMKYLAGDQ